MTTTKKVGGFYELWMVNKNGSVTIPLVISEKEFDEKKMSKRCFGYRFFKSNTKNGVATGKREYGEFIWPVSLVPKLTDTEREKNLKVYQSVKISLS